MRAMAADPIAPGIVGHNFMPYICLGLLHAMRACTFSAVHILVTHAQNIYASISCACIHGIAGVEVLQCWRIA